MSLDALLMMAAAAILVGGATAAGADSPFRERLIHNALDSPVEDLCTMIGVRTQKRVDYCLYRFLPDLFTPEERAQAEAELQRDRREIEAVCDRAHALGWQTYIGSYEVHYPDAVREKHPEILADVDHVVGFLESKLYETFSEMPCLDAFMMTTSESRRRAETAEEIAAYALAAHRALKRVEQEQGAPKRLILRTWLSGWRERLLLDMFPLRGVPAEVAREIVLCTKNTTGDFAMMDPFNPLFARATQFHQFIEFDVGGEYRGFNWYPCAMGRRWQTHLREARRLGVTGVAFNWCPFEPRPDSNKNGWSSGYEVKNYGWGNLNATALAALVRDPNCDVDAVQRGWVREHFGDAAVEPLSRVLDMSYEVMGKILYTRTIGHNDHSAFSNAGMRPTIFDRTQYILWEWRGAQRPDAVGLLDINRDNVEAIVREKIEGVAGAREMLAIVEGAEKPFAPEQYQSIRRDLRGMVNYAEANRYYIEAYFRCRLAETLRGSSREDELARLRDAIAAGRAIQKAEPDFPGRDGPKRFTLLFDEIEERLSEGQEG
jgi:hypothetical protein